MPRVIIPSSSGEILFVTDQSASLDFRRNPGLRSGSGIIGKWEVDPDDATSIQFRIPKEKIGTSNDRIAFYISGSGKIGVGTKDPETAFDVRDNTEDADPKNRAAKTKIFKVSKTTQTFDTPVTASIISASGNSIFNTGDFKGNLNVGGNLDVTGEIECDHLNISDTDDGIHFGDTTTIHVDSSNNLNVGVDGVSVVDLELYGHNHTYKAGNNLTVDAAGDITLDAAGNQVFFKDNGTTSITIDTSKGHITASGNISSSGNFIGNNIGSGIYDNRIYLTPTDFFPNGDNQSTRNDSGYIAGDGGHIIDPGRRLSYYAQKVIPKGYEATHVLVKGNNGTNVVRVYSSSFGEATAGQAGPDGTVGTILNFTSSAIVGGTNGTYCSVKWIANSLSQCYGGYIQIRSV